MLNTRLFTAVFAAATLGLAACSAGPVEPGPSPTAGVDAAALDSVAWSTGADDLPVLTFDSPLVVESDGARLIDAGDGAPLEIGQTIVLDYVLYTGEDGERQTSTYELGGGETVVFTREQLTPSLFAVLQGANVGAQAVFATLDFGAANSDGTYPTILLATTVTSAMPTVTSDVPVAERATGEPVPPVDGLPAITLDDTGKPSVDFSAATLPEGLVSQLLIRGDGPAVIETQSLTVHYTGWLWDGAQFDSSWDRGDPSTFGLNQVIAGWTQGLTGVPVGSQVLLVVPSDLGYGDAGTSGIPGGATLVFVVDVLAAS